MQFIKNFIYNFSDIFVALIIIALASFLIWTRIEVILAYPDSDFTAQKQVAEVTEKDTSKTEINKSEEPENTIPEVSYVKKIETEEISYKEVGIAAGTTTEGVAELLKQNSVISDMSYFISQLRSKKLEGHINPGVYTIPKGSSMDDLINILCNKTQENAENTANCKEISIPKDSSTDVVAGLLKQAGIITDTNHFIDQIKSMNLEGKIDPGVYQIPVGSSMEELIHILCKNSGN